MGWTNTHLWKFKHYGNRFTDKSSGAWGDPDDEAEDVACFRLSNFLHNPGNELTYK